MHVVRTDKETAGWSLSYGRALNRYLLQGPGASLLPALRLGRRAASLGLETLDLAVVHEQVMMCRPGAPAARGPRRLDRARTFFTECLVPIEATHRAALKAGLHVHRLTRALRRRTVESSASSRRLELGVARRRAAEAALARGRKHLNVLLETAGRLHDRMRSQARTVLSEQEVERGRTSRQLQDEIAQTLLAIKVRLLTLKTASAVDMEKLEKEIADMRRLVKQSAGIIHKVAHEFGIHHEA